MNNFKMIGNLKYSRLNKEYRTNKNFVCKTPNLTNTLVAYKYYIYQALDQKPFVLLYAKLNPYVC